jgi:hypothetical protein
MQSRIEQQVMASVGVVYTARKLTSRIALEFYALAAAGVALWQVTWVHKVIANFANVERGGLGSMEQYISYAFLHTHLVTQAALVVAAVAAVLLIADALRALSRPAHRFAH